MIRGPRVKPRSILCDDYQAYTLTRDSVAIDGCVEDRLCWPGLQTWFDVTNGTHTSLTHPGDLGAVPMIALICVDWPSSGGFDCRHSIVLHCVSTI